MEDLSQPLVSVVIPCYNAENYIATCIKSVLSQTYQSVEIIVINDGSTDKSMDRISEFNDRISCYTTLNKGVSHARNYGIEKATGTYLMFVDADDILLSNAITSLVNVARRTKTEFVVSGQFTFANAGDGSGKRRIRRIESASFHNRKDLFQHLSPYYNTLEVNPPYGRLYVLKTIRQQKLHFDEDLSIGEDFLFNLSYYSKINSAEFLSDVYYGYRKDVGGLTSRHSGDFWQSKGRMLLRSSILLSNQRVPKVIIHTQLVKLVFSYFLEFVNSPTLTTSQLRQAIVRLVRDEKVIEACASTFPNHKINILRIILKSKNVLLIQFTTVLLTLLNRIRSHI